MTMGSIFSVTCRLPDGWAVVQAIWCESLDRIMACVDVLSINGVHTPTTFQLLNVCRLKLMKPKAVIMNTSCGEGIDENAGPRMLHAEKIAGRGWISMNRGK